MFVLLVIMALLIGLVVVLAVVGAITSETNATGTGNSGPAPGSTSADLRRAPRTGTKHPSPSQHKEREMIANHVKPTTHHVAPHASRQELDACKTIHAFDFILKSFGQTPAWSTAAERDDYAHDLAVMLRHGDLEQASLELLGADNTVIYRHRIEFGKNGGPGSVDAAGGIEVPLLAPDQIACYRFLVSPASRRDTYRNELRRNWGQARQLDERAGSRFHDEHIRRVNAGRMTGEVFVADEARQTVTVLNVAADGQYAFGRAAGLAADVFLHRGQCENGLTFQAGQRLNCVVIQTPRGLQGRNIQTLPQAARTGARRTSTWSA